MTGAAGQVSRFSNTRGSGRVVSRGVSNLTGRVGSGRVESGQDGFKYHASGRVGSDRVGSGRIRRVSDLTGRDGSGHPVA